jgi:hypothetical protein
LLVEQFPLEANILNSIFIIDSRNVTLKICNA